MSSAALAISPDDMTAGLYIGLRREAAGKSREEAARAYAFSAEGARSAELLLADAENDRVKLGKPGLVRLKACFRFDVDIYLALAGVEEDLPIPSICHLCGCSWEDACLDERGVGCAWANLDETLCSSCASPGGCR